MHKRGNKGRAKSKKPSPQSLPVIRPKVAGIDIGSREQRGQVAFLYAADAKREVRVGRVGNQGVVSFMVFVTDQ